MLADSDILIALCLVLKLMVACANALILTDGACLDLRPLDVL